MINLFKWLKKKKKKEVFIIEEDDPALRAVVERCLQTGGTVFAHTDEEGNLHFDDEKESPAKGQP